MAFLSSSGMLRRMSRESSAVLRAPLLRYRMIDQAVASFEGALAQNPDNLSIKFPLSLLYFQLEQYDRSYSRVTALLTSLWSSSIIDGEVEL